MRWRVSTALVGALLLSGVAACVAVPGSDGPPSSLSRAGTPSQVHFTAAGDYGSTPAAGSVLEALGDSGADVHFALGDLSYGRAGEESEWCRFVTDRVGAALPFELVAGNHESDDKNGNIADFAACLPNRLPGLVGSYPREYYVDVPAQSPLVRFIMVSPSLTFPDGTWSYVAGSTHLAWTAAAIETARAAGVPWVVVGMHKPCLSVGNYACDVGPDLLHMLISQRVDLVLSGHEHLYQRTQQVAEGPGCARVTIDTFTPACVADAGNDLVAGAGTVFATVGTGGITLRRPSATDTEAPYFATVAGVGDNPTHGYLDAVVTPTAMRVSFVRASGGTFSDSFALSRPVAS
jgi:3',5'-cyclic AMP phosphodiesterase CpdA